MAKHLFRKNICEVPKLANMDALRLLLHGANIPCLIVARHAIAIPSLADADPPTAFERQKIPGHGAAIVIIGFLKSSSW